MPLREDLLNPIPGANPSGANLRYDAVFDEIKEARREELEAPQGAWKTAYKVADYARVIQLAGDVLANRSKHLQIAVWLVDAHVRREGFTILPACFRFLEELCERFWENIHPEIEDGDAEMRAAPLVWLGSRLEEPIRLLPLTNTGLSWFRYKESRAIGYKQQADTTEKRKAREQAVNEGKTTAEDFDAAMAATPREVCEGRLAIVREARAQLGLLTAFLDAKFAEEPPSFLPVRKALDDIEALISGFIAKRPAPAAAVEQSKPVATQAEQQPAAASQEAPPPPKKESTPAPVAQAAPTTSGVAGPIDPSDFNDAVRRVNAVGRYLRARDAYDVSPYLIVRAFRWGELRYQWPNLDRALLLPPDDSARGDLTAAFNASQWNRVLELTEEAMELPCGRGWLDLQRYAVKALENKGKDFQILAIAIRSALKSLLEDFPTLPEADLRDGTPAADNETRDWIRNVVLSGAAMPALAPTSNATQSTFAALPTQTLPATVAASTLEVLGAATQIQEENVSEELPGDVFTAAVRATKNGEISEALRLLNDEIGIARSGRDRFRRKIQLAHILMAAGKQKVAQPVLDEVAQEIQTRHLEDWEDREALAYPLSLLLCCADGDGDKRRRLYDAVCRLDPVRALTLPG